MTIARVLGVVLLAAVAEFGAVRAMTFVAPPVHPLRALAPLFASHPDALTTSAMVEIGTSAARGGTVPQTARRAIASVAIRAPLAPDPFLVEGAIAEMADDRSRAERLFLEARDRDPRSEGARYFLADRYLKTNRILSGLVELGALARLSDKASQPLIPALAAYARTPGGIAELRRYFALAPVTRDSTLALLAEDSRNAPLILSLAPAAGEQRASADWQGRLIQSLIRDGDFAGADALWHRVTGIANRGLLFNPQFRVTAAPPPFSWSLLSGPAGVAEPSGRGGLDVIYYGRADVTLASQLLRLSPGRYRLAMRVEGQSQASGLAWAISCVITNQPLLQLPLGTVGKGAIAGSFAVPAAACPAQAIELRGSPADSGATEQFRLFDLKLDPLAVAP